MDRLFAVNVKGTLFAIQEVGRHMAERRRGGKIINMASQAGRRGEALVGAYCASKAAVISLTQSAGLDLIKYGINVNAIAPGVVDTPMWDVVDASFARHEKLPIGDSGGQLLVLFHAEPGSDSAAGLARLAELSAARRQPAPNARPTAVAAAPGSAPPPA